MVKNEHKDVSDTPVRRFENAPLAEKLDNNTMKSIKQYDKSLTRKEGKETQEVNPPIKNKQDGLEREHNVEKELKQQYPFVKGYTVISEAYLRNKDGKIVSDPVTGEARRIDFVVVKGNSVVASVEVTSKTADKTN